MTGFTIDELSIPADLDAPDAADFIAMADLRNAVEADGYGTDELSTTAAELLPGWLNLEYEPKRLFVARVDGRIVARSIFETRPSAESGMAWFDVQVHPDFRRRGIGSALADRLDALAAAAGCTSAVVYAVSKDAAFSKDAAISPDAAGERLHSPTGFGSVPRSNPEVKFLLGRGYSLEQVERGSRLALPVDPARLARFQDDALVAAGSDYRLRQWTGRTPEQWIDDMALLFTRMSTDAPTAGLDEPEDVWTRERLIDHEKQAELSPKTIIVSTVEHVPSGHLVGLTELGAPRETGRPVSQNDTIVLREHRGHRLGMLLKAANIGHLEGVAPGHPSVITFNAEENRHMLDVNEAIGFAPIGYEGAWKKLLGAR